MNKQEYEKTVKDYANAIFRTVYAFCQNRSDAEDVVQNTFYKLFVREEAFDSEMHKKNWLYKVAVNEAKNIRKSRWFSYERIEEQDWSVNPEETQRQDVYYAVMKLSDKNRLVVMLYYYEGYSIKEITRITGVRESAVQNRLQRARRHLKKLLEEYWDEESE